MNTRAPTRAVDWTGVSGISVEVATNPLELSQARIQDRRFALNSAWLQAHVSEVYSQYRGRCICIAGEELFVADDVSTAVALASNAHPDDDGQLVRYIPKLKGPRIYENQRILVAL